MVPVIYAGKRPKKIKKMTCAIYPGHKCEIKKKRHAAFGTPNQSKIKFYLTGFFPVDFHGFLSS